MNNILELIGKKFQTTTSVGLGYVVVPPDVDRDTYIANCYLNETVSILPDNGGFSFNNIKVSKSALQDIEFPKGKDGLGSCVVYLLHPRMKYPIIIAVIGKNNESAVLNYKEFKLTKSDGTNSVTILGSGTEGNLFLSVESEGEDKGGIYVTVNNRDNLGVLSLEVKGDVIIISKSLTAEIKENISLKSKEFLLENKKTVIKSEDEILLGVENYQKAVLGDDLVEDVLRPLISCLKSFIVITVQGVPGVSVPSSSIDPTTLSSLEQINKKLDSILSQKVKIE